MRDGFEQYRAEMDAVRLTENEKAALVQTLTERKTQRPVRVRRAALAAAALAIGCLALCAAGWVSVHSQTGADIVENMLSYNEAKCPVNVRDGQVWLTADGEETNITGLFDEQTPYICLVRNEVEGVIEHIVVGGAPEDPGYMDVLTGLEEINGWPCAITGRGASLLWGQYNFKWKDWAYNALEEIGVEGIEKDLPEGNTDLILAIYYFEIQ